MGYRPAEENLETIGYIYFIYAPEVVRFKIGWSMLNPNSRFDTCDTGSPVDLVRHSLIRGPFELEGQLHKRFKAYHRKGEWFSAGPLLREYIEANARPWVELLAEEAAASEAYWAPIKKREAEEWREDAACIMKDFRENFDKVSTAFMMPSDKPYRPPGKGLPANRFRSPRAKLVPPSRGFSPEVQALYDQVLEDRRIAKAERAAKRATLTPEPRP